MLLRSRRIIALNLFILMGIAVSAAAGSSATPATTAKKKPATHHATTRKTSSHSSSHKKSGRHTRKTSRVHGQQKIDPQRARNIQEALIRDHYLSGEPTGTWDANSQRAMEKFQADNGWQTKEIPDSRALIKLGLGPDQQHLLNPDSAMTMTTPDKMRPPAQAKAQGAPSTTPTSTSTAVPSAGDSSSQN